MSRKLISWLLISGLWVLSACNPTPTTAPTPLTVFAAASLTEAFTELGHNFEAQHPNTAVVFNFGASNQLAQQLVQGAPADVFASANTAQMDVAVQAERIITGSPQTFVQNRLVVVFPADNPAQISTLQDLAQPGLKLVLAAPAVPVGQYALNFLDQAAADPAFGPTFKDDVLKNVVSYEENVRAVLSKVILGEADAGIVYTSDVSGTASVGRLDIPDAFNTIATYPIAALSDSAQPTVAQQFIAYVLSPAGQAVLARYGFIPAK